MHQALSDHLDTTAEMFSIRLYLDVRILDHILAPVFALNV